MSQTVETRGYSAKDSSRPVGRLTIAMAWAIDVSLALLACLGALSVSPLSPTPHKQWVLAILAAVALFGPGLRVLAHATLGERAWDLRAPDGVSGKLRSVSSESGRTAMRGSFLTLAAVLTLIFSINYGAGSTPLWAQAPTERLQPFLPQKNSGWAIDAFYYTLGAWPKSYRGRPVFYSIPYEKGPPAVFLGQIDAHWDTGVRVTMEGPQTPMLLSSGLRSRDQLRACITAAPVTFDGGRLSAMSCLKLREKTLLRHVTAMQAVHPTEWHLRWFIVENPAIPPDEQAQGIYLEAIGRKFAQSRYILVTARGTNEAIIANYPSAGADARQVRETVSNVVASLRVSDDLNQSRAWADQQLEHTHLEELKTITDPAKLTVRLSEIEATLLSKISVDPKTYDAYFHLGGVAMMIAREGVRQKEPEWQTASAMLASLLHYARDIAPEDARTVQLENLWLESKKL